MTGPFSFCQWEETRHCSCCHNNRCRGAKAYHAGHRQCEHALWRDGINQSVQDLHAYDEPGHHEHSKVPLHGHSVDLHPSLAVRDILLFLSVERNPHYDGFRNRTSGRKEPDNAVRSSAHLLQSAPLGC